MSKASEWAKVQAKEPPGFSIRFNSMFSRTVAEVDRSGMLILSPKYSLDQKSALALADWIYATFGEENEQAD